MMTTGYDLICVGNYTKDTVMTPAGTRVVDGGAINYAAHAAARLGLKTAVVTRLAREDEPVMEGLRRAGVDCYPTYTPNSTLLTLEYKTSNVDQRTLTVAATAGTITPQQIEGLHARAVVVGGSLRGEVEPVFFRALRERAGLWVGCDVQGFVRVLRGRSLVYQPWDAMAEVLGCVDILKSDMVEAEFLTGETDLYRAARHYASLGPREIVLTHSQGVLIHAEGKDYEYPFFAGDVAGRSGRGDTCLGSYTALRLSRPAPEAGRWAAALTSLKLQKPGPFSQTFADVQAFVASHYGG